MLLDDIQAVGVTDVFVVSIEITWFVSIAVRPEARSDRDITYSAASSAQVCLPHRDHTD